MLEKGALVCGWLEAKEEATRSTSASSCVAVTTSTQLKSLPKPGRQGLVVPFGRPEDHAVAGSEDAAAHRDRRRRRRRQAHGPVGSDLQPATGLARLLSL